MINGQSLLNKSSQEPSVQSQRNISFQRLSSWKVDLHLQPPFKSSPFLTLTTQQHHDFQVRFSFTDFVTSNLLQWERKKNASHSNQSGSYKWRSFYLHSDCFYTMSYNIYLTVLNGLKRNSMARQTFDHHLTPIEGRIFLWIELLLLGLLSQVMPLYTSENATSRLLTKGGLLARIPNMASHIPQWTTALNSLHFSCS